MTTEATPALPRDLGGGLTLRRGTAADTEAIVAFNRRTHSWSPADPLKDEFAAWTRDLLAGTHPTAGPGDFTVVEDTATGALVSTLLLISQAWSYDGIPVKVGRPELVGTDPAYRRRGLVRAQLDVVHGWSASRGELVQGITGIPWYYRQFGYEMTLALDHGRIGYAAQIPPLPAGTPEPYALRPATEADLPFLMRTYEAGVRRYGVAALRDEAQWRYELAGRRPGSLWARAFRVIEGPGGAAVGMLVHWPFLFEGRQFVVQEYELVPGTPYTAVTPSVLRYARAAGAEGPARPGVAVAGVPDSYVFLLGAGHPAFAATPGFFPQERRPYAWYLRVPDLPRFVRHIAPALERRLAASPLAGWGGECRISFYRDGLALAFAGGRLTRAEAWQPAPGAEGDCAFPDRTFLHLLFGHRSLDEVRHLFADCWADPEAAALLGALFPPVAADVWGLA
jgi:hypothetical protein